MFKNICKILVLILIIHNKICVGQIFVEDSNLDYLTNAYVKSLDEFIQRFNADEFHPDIDIDNDVNLRSRSILSLFDRQRFHIEDSVVAIQLISFADTVSSKNIKLRMESEGIYAEACCLFKYKEKEIPLNIVLVFENIKDDYYKWAVVGANGLIESQLIDTINNGYISPVQHEMHFMELSDACTSDLTRFLSTGRTVDQLSFMLGMLKTGQLEFVSCKKVLFHIIQVPNYIIVVDKVNRLDNNSGYLITSLINTDRINKQNYINQLLGEE